MERRSIMRRVETGIYQMDDGRYRVRTTAKGPDGRIVQREATVDTLEDARAGRKSLKAGILGAEKRPQMITFGDYSMQWVVRKSKRLKASTMTKNVRTLAHHILPEIGHIPLAEIQRRDVADWLAWVETQKREDGLVYSTATVQSWWRVLRNVLRDAHAQGYLREDITARQEAPHTGIKDRQEKRTLTAEQLRELVDAAKHFTPTRHAEIATLAYTGMRIGEMYALHWEDIDLGTDEIRVVKSVWRGEMGATKTGKARAVPIPSFLAEILAAHRSEQMRDQHPGLETGIAFPATHGSYRESSSLRKSLDILGEHLGSRVTPQVLRRTYNSIVRDHADRIVLRSIVGHSSEQMTELYSHVGMGAKRDAVEKAFKGK
jgi:integrase